MKDKNGEELNIASRTRSMSAARRQRAVRLVQKELHVNQMSDSACWTRLPEPGAPTFLAEASSLPSGFTVKHGSTVAVLLSHGDLHAVNDLSAQADKRLKYFLVDAIASCAGNAWFAARQREVYQEESLKTEGQPARVKLMSDSQMFLIRVENVTQQALVLEGHNRHSLSSKMSGFTFITLPLVKRKSKCAFTKGLKGGKHASHIASTVWLQLDNGFGAQPRRKVFK